MSLHLPLEDISIKAHLCWPLVLHPFLSFFNSKNLDALLRESHHFPRFRRHVPEQIGYRTVDAVAALAGEKKDGKDKTFRTPAAQALEELTSLGETRATAQVILNMGRDASNPQQSLSCAERARSMFEACGDPIGVSNAMQNAGALLAQLGQYKEGAAMLEQALEIKRHHGDMVGAATALLNIASCAVFAGNYTVGVLKAAESVTCIERIMTAPARAQTNLIWQTHGWEPVPADCRSLLATAYNNYGNALSVLGELDKSIECYGKARAIMCELGDTAGEAMVLNQIGEVLRQQGEFARAEELYHRSVHLFEESGTQSS